MEPAGQWIGWWLSRPVPAVLGILVAICVGLAILVYALVVGRHTRDFMARHCRATSVVMMPLTLMFGLLVGFLGAEIHQRNQRACRCVADEGRALETIHFLTRTPQPQLMSVRDAARGYAALVVEEEFPRFGQHGESPAAVAAVDALERVAADYAMSPGSSAVAAGGIMEAVLLLKKSRDERVLVRGETSEFEWFTVLVLSLLGIVAIGLSHTSEPRVMIVVWGLFIPAVVVVLGMLALRENPYRPPLSVSAAPLESALRHLSTP